MLAVVEQSLAWLQSNPGWAGLFLGVISFAESFALLGLFVPATAIMVGTGALIGAGHFDFYTMVAYAFIGAVLGDSASFYLGYHYHEHFRRLRIWQRYQSHITRAEDFFHRHGMASVFWGRFVGPVRPIIPFVAGMLSMPIKQFLFANVLSALFWAPAYLLPGILLGATTQFSSTQAEQLWWWLFGFAICLILGIVHFKKLIRKGYTKTIRKHELLLGTVYLAIAIGLLLYLWLSGLHDSLILFFRELARILGI